MREADGNPVVIHGEDTFQLMRRILQPPPHRPGYVVCRLPAVEDVVAVEQRSLPAERGRLKIHDAHCYARQCIRDSSDAVDGWGSARGAIQTNVRLCRRAARPQE